MRCEDYPCCGHDICPDFDASGRQINMKCTCGKTIPLDSHYSLCDSCLSQGDEDEFWDTWDEDEDEELARDRLLERQELEDFEGLDDFDGCLPI